MKSSSQTGVIRLRSLAGHGGVDLAVRGFTSLAECSDRPLHFIVHDDGTLSGEDRDRLQSARYDITFVDRRTADAAVEPMLARHPHARAFRRHNTMAPKLLDVPLLAGADFAYTDTDILAFRPYTGLFDWPDETTTAVFMPDSQNAYALRPWHLLGADAVTLPMRTNAGFMMFRTAEYDLDFVEWFLSRPFGVYQRIPGWIEQTCWAALAQRGRCRVYDGSQVRVVRDAGCLNDPELVIGHFTSPVRALWAEACTPSPGPLVRIRVRTVPAVPLTASHLAGEHVRRAARRSRLWIRRRVAESGGKGR